MKEMSENTEYGYIKFTRAFVSFRWYKPLLVMLLTAIFSFIFIAIISVISFIWNGTDNAEAFIAMFDGSYENMDAFSGPGALLNLGSWGVVIPALFLAVLIVRDRPFSSYSSSRGGWNPGLFIKCLLLAAAAYGVSFGINVLADPGSFHSEKILFDVPGFITLSIVLPFQCIAEEYIFRGLLMQTFGAWIRIPAIAIILQAGLFAWGHSYNITGVIAIFISGIIFGILAHFTKGLEASCALHIIGNYLSFYISGFGLDKPTSEIDMASLVATVATDAAFAAAVILLGRKFNWFYQRKDTVSEFNARKMAKK